MPIVSLAFPAANAPVIIPYPFAPSPSALIIPTRFLIIALVTSIANSIILLGAFVDRKSHFATANLVLMYGLVSSDWFAGVHTVFIMIYNLSWNGYALGETYCFALQIMCVSVCISSILILLCISLDRYMTLFHQVSLNVPQAWSCLLGIGVSCLILGFMPYWTMSSSLSVSLSPSLLLCNNSWHVVKGVTLLMNILCVTLAFVAMSGMIFIYSTINFYYHKIGKVKKVGGGGGGGGVGGGEGGGDKALKQRREKEWKLLKKSILLCGSFLICWFPYFLLAMISMITEAEVSPIFDGISTLFILVNSMVNPFLMYIFDPTIKRNVNSLFNIIGGVGHGGKKMFKETSKVSLLASANIPPTLHVNGGIGGGLTATIGSPVVTLGDK